MASRATAVHQTENLCTDIGKYVAGGSKADLSKPAKNGRWNRSGQQARRPFADLSNIVCQNRKPLCDVSNTGKFPATGPLKESIPIDNSAVRARGIIKNTSKGKILTDEEIIRCHEWAEEGIELVHFTGNDLQKVQKNDVENCVKKKVERMMAAVHEWPGVTYELVLPVKKEVSKNDIIQVEKMETEEETLPKSISTSGTKEIDDILCEPELHNLHLPEFAAELKMKDDYSTAIDTANHLSACLK